MARISGIKTERTGREKAAMLLISLGPERSAEIFKHLKEEEIEQLTLEIANIRTVTPEERKVLRSSIRYVLPRNTLLRGYQPTQRKYWKKHWGLRKLSM